MTDRPTDAPNELRGRAMGAVDAPRPPWAGPLLLHTFVSAALFGILFAVFSLISGWQTHDSIGPFALPLMLGFGISVVPLVYNVVLSRHSFALAIVVSALFVGVYSVGAGMLITSLARASIIDIGVLWHLAGAGLWGLLAVMVCAFWPAAEDSAGGRHRPRADLSLSDQEWAKQTAAHLRARGDMTDSHVRDILAEAREQALVGGASLVSTFGAPSEYAGRPAPQRGVAARRQALLYTAITAFPVWHLVRHVLNGGWTWDAGVFWAGLWLVAAATAAVLAWRTSLQRSS